MKYNSSLYKFYHWLASIPPKITFKTRDPLTDEERLEIVKKLASGYYIILTGNNWHLSSLSVKFITFLKTGKWTRYSHVLMNCDFIDTPEKISEFKFMEATVTGVHYSTFEEVFDCDSVCILTPKNVTNQEWTAIIDRLVENDGKPYDDLFQLTEHDRLSCVELVLVALQADSNYTDSFPNLEKMIQEEGNLLPQMFRDCKDFTVDYEV